MYSVKEGKRTEENQNNRKNPNMVAGVIKQDVSETPPQRAPRYHNWLKPQISNRGSRLLLGLILVGQIERQKIYYITRTSNFELCG